MSHENDPLVPTVLVMNDQYWLPYALKAIQGRFSKYVIYNAGSEDNTGDIIDWFVETSPPHTEFFIRDLPFAIPTVQGCYRNSMLVEAGSEWTLMVDADEVYNPYSLYKLSQVRLPGCQGDPEWGQKLKYGVFRRTELESNLLHRYSEERSHHRLYRRNAYFKGTHPGEVPFFKQKPANEIDIPDVMCWHFHNTLRSPLEGSVPKRLDRKSQGTYHPGELVAFDLLKELPILREPINDFPVSPDLEKLQHGARQV